MNCKPGDLAVTVGLRNPANNGRIVTCIRLVSEDEDIEGFNWSSTIPGTSWLVQSAGGFLWWGCEMVMKRAIADHCLRPIRDPGDDAQDETLSWLKVPSGNEVPA